MLAGVVVIYGQAASFEFVRFDDQAYLADNPIVSQGLRWSGIQWAFTTTTLANWFPLTWISHMSDVTLFGLSPRGHHLTNIAFHAVNACLVLAWLWGMTGAFWRSALVAGLFAFHPLNVESVAWVAERKNVLSTFFLLCALLAYVRYVRRPGLGRYAAVFFLLVASLLSKAMAVTLPLLLLLLDVWPLDRIRLPGRLAGDLSSHRPGLPLRRALLEKLPLLLLAMASSVVTYLVQAGSGYVGLLKDLTPTIRAANAGVSTLVYLRRTIWPSDLACFYPHPEGTLPVWEGMLSFAVLATMTIVLLTAAHKKRPFLVVGWLWFLICLIPVLGFIQVGWQAMADRYGYVPLIGVFIAVSWASTGLADLGAVARSIMVVLMLAALGACTVTARVQAGYWRNTFTLFDRALAVTECNWLAHSTLAEAYAAQGDNGQAMVHMREAMRLNSRYALRNGGAAPRSKPPGHPVVPGSSLPPGHPRL